MIFEQNVLFDLLDYSHDGGGGYSSGQSNDTSLSANPSPVQKIDSPAPAQYQDLVLPVQQTNEDIGINIPIPMPVSPAIPFDGVHPLPEVVVMATKKKAGYNTCCCFTFWLLLLLMIFKNKTKKR